MVSGADLQTGQTSLTGTCLVWSCDKVGRHWDKARHIKLRDFGGEILHEAHNSRFSIHRGSTKIDKDKKDYSSEDISSIMKNAKVRHILHNSLDSVMSNRVFGCKTSKEIWDALEVKCQGTTAIKKNRRTIFTQEYEHFDSRENESLAKIYDRFQKLLNDLSLVNKEYDL
ncbi:hypothetical protein AgCh_038664 [Apium graveolens]